MVQINNFSSNPSTADQKKVLVPIASGFIFVQGDFNSTNMMAKPLEL
jgi:hypothetical protein